MDNYENLKPNIENGKIINIEAIVEALKKVDDQDFLSDYLEEITDFINNGGALDEEDSNSLQNALNIRLEELKKKELTNEDILNSLKKSNPDLEGLSIISTSKEDNLSGRNTEYIKFVTPNNEVLLLECYGQNTLRDYLTLHPEFGTTGSASDLFNYYKNHVHQEVEMTNANNLESVNHLKEMHSGELDKEGYDKELEEVNKYAKEHGITSEIDVGISDYGDRLYRIGTTIIKFKTGTNNEKKLIVISEEAKDKNNDLTSNQNNENNPQTETIKEANQAPTSDINETREQDYIDNEQEKDVEQNVTYLEFGEIFRKITNAETLTSTEESKLDSYISNALESSKNDTIKTDDQNALDVYINYLNEKESLTPKEQTVLDSYNNNVKEKQTLQAQKEAVAKENNEIKVLQMKPLTDDSKTSGYIITVAILEISILLGILISVLAIALK
jgi:hypothetical protein